MPSRGGTRASSKEAPPRRSELASRFGARLKLAGTGHLWDWSFYYLQSFFIAISPLFFSFLCVCFCPEVSLVIEQYFRSKLFSWGGGRTKYLLL